MNHAQKRYHPLAILLHWVMAFAFLCMLTSGLVMAYADIPKPLKFQMYQWHKSLGVLLLCAFFLRISIRLWVPHPALPATMKPLEQKAATAGHWALYFWMFALPFTGWLTVSSSPYGLPTIVFGWFEWPHFPGIAGNKEVQDAAGELHEWLAFSFMALIAGHIAAVIKHAVIDRENLLPRMGIGHSKDHTV